MDLYNTPLLQEVEEDFLSLKVKNLLQGVELLIFNVQIFFLIIQWLMLRVKMGHKVEVEAQEEQYLFSITIWRR